MFKEKRKNKIRIGIDARMYGPIGKGLGRYIQEVVDNVLKIDRENEYVIFLSKDNFDEFEFNSKRVEKVLADARWYTLKEQVVMPYLICKNKLNLMHFPHFNVPVFTPGRFVVTIHDLILTKFPTTRASTLGPILYKIKNIFYKIVIYLAVKRAKKVIAVSNFTKNDIVEKFKINPKKIVVTYEGVSNLAKGRDSLFVSKLDDRETLLSYNINKRFLLYVGNAYPHKNLDFLIDVFKDIHKKYPEIDLVLVGKEDYFYSRLKNKIVNNKEIKKIGLDKSVIFPGYVPDEKLEIMYQKALAYIFPSLYEGFGLPPLEAMAKGCPVLSSDQSSMPEILGDAAIYFNPYRREDLIEKLDKIINNKNIR
ncbi:glycosyltransferase family 4 protein [bacterium]|nr:glycosyltransferase family 4 protein [bacterium]